MKIILITLATAFSMLAGLFAWQVADIGVEDKREAEATIRKFWDLALVGETKKAEAMTADGMMRSAGFDIGSGDCCKIAEIRTENVKLGEKLDAEADGKVIGFYFKGVADDSREAKSYLICSVKTKYDEHWKIVFVSSIKDDGTGRKETIDLLCLDKSLIFSAPGFPFENTH
jgi:hypothetical protein